MMFTWTCEACEGCEITVEEVHAMVWMYESHLLNKVHGDQKETKHISTYVSILQQLAQLVSQFGRIVYVLDEDILNHDHLASSILVVVQSIHQRLERVR
jgi:hypothetical protein